MAILLVIAKALCLILLAVFLFFGFAMGLDISAISAPQEELCAGQPITRCFLTII